MVVDKLDAAQWGAWPLLRHLRCRWSRQGSSPEPVGSSTMPPA